jgi:hypothetical protein
MATEVSKPPEYASTTVGIILFLLAKYGYRKATIPFLDM